ncbi:hypothetical protein [Microvirga massiliensis]|uniref:hypothetical protein n=1 Tax=Microvirga massiliensis TaxID=1033741 RepID=UPI00062B7078|nr:hypothetical protein [Microvirga massiliensis]
MDDVGYVYFTATSDEAQNISVNGLSSVCVELDVSGENVIYDGLYIGRHLDDVTAALTDERPVLIRFNLDSVAEIFDFIDLESSVNGADQFGIALDRFTIPSVELEYLDTLSGNWNDMQTFTIDISAVADESVAVEPTSAKKVYDTPYLPRGLWFKKMREEGLLALRQPKAKKAPASQDAAGDKPVRSPAQLAAIRGYYARKARLQAA